MAERGALGVEEFLSNGEEVGEGVYFPEENPRRERRLARSVDKVIGKRILSGVSRKGCLRSCTAVHNCVESSLDSAIIPLAVPLRRKSASLTLLMNASCSTRPSASSRTSCSSGHALKCTVNRHGSEPVFPFPPSSSSSGNPPPPWSSS